MQKFALRHARGFCVNAVIDSKTLAGLSILEMGKKSGTKERKKERKKVRKKERNIHHMHKSCLVLKDCGYSFFLTSIK